VTSDEPLQILKTAFQRIKLVRDTFRADAAGLDPGGKAATKSEKVFKAMVNVEAESLIIGRRHVRVR
jgi:hypothetical protein